MVFKESGQQNDRPKFTNKEKFVFCRQKAKKKIPNTILTFFLIMQFVYGLNFGFIGVLNKNIRHFCKLIYLFDCFYTSIILLLNTPIFLLEWNVDGFMHLLFFAQYCGHIILLYFVKYKVYNFITDMRSINNGIHSNEQNIGLFACVVFGYWFVHSMVYLVVICAVNIIGCSLKYTIFLIMYQIPLIGLDSIVLVQLIVNLYTYSASVYLVGLVGTKKISLIRKQFLRVSECCDKFGGQYGNLVVMELLIHLPKYVILICDFLYNIKETGMRKFYLFQVLYSIYALLQMCAPTIIVECTKKQMETVKYKLYTRLMEKNDIVKHLELSSLLRYMEQKPLYSKAWRVIPTDINLVVALFGFTATNIIVIIQFMHIY